MLDSFGILDRGQKILTVVKNYLNCENGGCDQCHKKLRLQDVILFAYTPLHTSKPGAISPKKSTSQ